MKTPIRYFIFYSFAISIASCASNPYAPSNKIYKQQAKDLAKTIRKTPLVNTNQDWVGTTNFSLRKPNFVIIHHTAQKSTQETLTTFTSPKSEVSIHYLIGKDGKVYHMLNDYLRAWHGGIAKWGNLTDINSASIGIELDNDGFSSFSDLQIQSLILVLTALKKDYNIPTANFIGHSDIAPGRKVDPNANFPWKKLSEHGFGNWPDSILLDSVPQNFNPQEALRIIGYNTSNLTAAIGAFKLHFIQTDLTAILTEEDKKVLFNLYKKYL